MSSLTASSLSLGKRSRFLLLVASAPAILLLGQLLPDSSPGLAVRLAAAGACVFLVPGALVLRAVAWPSSPGVAAAASFSISLALVAFALAAVLVLGTSILPALAILVAVSISAAVLVSLRDVPVQMPSSERRALAFVLAASIPVAAIVWWGTGPILSDTYFHLARTQKLAGLDELSSLSAVNEFEDGGLHPGYAFPLLHGADALVARLAGVDVADAVVYLPAVLVPLAFLLAYGAGAAVFQSWAGGVAVVLLQAAQVGLSRRDGRLEATGLFELLSTPQSASRVLLAPTILALAFAFLARGGWVLLACLGAASFALSVIHPTYTPYVALVFGGFLVTRIVFVRGWEPLLSRAAVALAAILVPFGALVVALLPIARETRAVTPSAADRAAGLARYGRALSELGDWYGYAPSAIVREGPVVVAGLIALPLAAFAARRVWAAFALGGSLAVLLVLITPPVFTALSDAVSLSQSRRLAGFLPIAFALAAACVVASRLKAVGVASAAAASVLLVLFFEGDFAFKYEEGGASWPVVVAVGGGLIALVAGAVLRLRGPSPGIWTAAVAGAFVLPIAVSGLTALERTSPITELTPGIVQAVRSHADSGDIVFSEPQTAFEIGAFAPVYVNAAPIGNVADTRANRRRSRAAHAQRFFRSPELTDADRRELLDRYDADWLLVDKADDYPEGFLRTLPRVYDDERYSLYRVS